MSDNTTNDYMTNTGITLPGNESATQDGGLSPLFLNRVGGNRWGGTSYPYANIERGQNGFLWANNSTHKATEAYWMGISLYTFWPSQRYYRSFSFPLRCLVSTNNG